MIFSAAFLAAFLAAVSLAFETLGAFAVAPPFLRVFFPAARATPRPALPLARALPRRRAAILMFSFLLDD